ncbi:Uridine kinase [Polyrhizophydium stewartii]|uniref:Uridine kinase n=1 Tax=Polyrhizophydium stewartii TaxID=2732419 RepID=A0ABR4N649_9FUNG
MASLENIEQRPATPSSLPRKFVKSESAGSFVSSAGRFPWFDAAGNPSQPYIIGIAGGSASGKTSVSQRIIKQLGVPWVVLLSMDSFYKSLTPEQIAAAHRSEQDFDHPDAFDYDILFEALRNLKRGIKVDVPVYDFATHSRLSKTTKIYGANVVIFEGILALHDKRVRDLMDLKIFVDTDDDIRLARRLRRDISERGRSIHSVLEQYRRFVKPSFDDFIHPTMRFADIIIPRGLDNVAAIDVITKHVSRQLKERGIELRGALLHSGAADELPPNVRLLPQRPQLLALHTIIRDENTNRHDFVFYAERLSRLVVEHGLAQLPFQESDVTTPTGAVYHGTVLRDLVCGVSIVRAGASMEHGLRQAVKDIPIGKILIQTDPSTGEPQLHYCKLPNDIGKRHVIVVDAQIATGAAAMMAIRVLLEHHVPENRILFLSLIASRVGLQALGRAFPKIKIITSSIDNELNDLYHIIPGFGNFGDRYFGTFDE